MGIEGVKNVILVLSGKGGVGKSTVAAHLALNLRDLNYKVGLLDVDICGPSIPYLLNLEGKEVCQCPEGWMPIYTDKSQMLSVMSIAFLSKNRNDAIVWRGPKKNAMIKQFISDVCWQSLDYLIIDMPPGTSDEHISLFENIKILINENSLKASALLITTPQMVSINDVRREITFCNKASLPILGIIENMSGFICPHCKECSSVFSKGGGEALAKETNNYYLGSLPLDPKFSTSLETRSLGNKISDIESLNIFQKMTEMIVNKMN